MSAPGDAPKSAVKIPLAQGAVTHVAQSRYRIHHVNPEWYVVGMSRPTPATYKTTNWPSYNEALKAFLF